MVLGLIKRLEEENQVNVYMANEKIPKVCGLPYWN